MWRAAVWALLIFGLIPVAWARIYYVSPTGNNHNPGTRAQPWATPGYASRQLSPGDTLIILRGRYVLSEYDADIIVPPSGTPSARTAICGDPNGRPVLAGRDNLLTAIDLSGKSYVRIENLEITHDTTAQGEAAWFREGIEVLGAPSQGLIFRGLYIHHIDEYGMNLQDVEGVKIEDCRIEYCGFGSLGGPAGDHGGWRDVTIRDCSLSWSGHYYQGGDGSNRPYDRPDGFGIEPSAGRIVIENTVAEHNYGDGLDSKAANTLITRCIVANNSCDGVKLRADNSRIENTLIYGRGDGNPDITPWAPIVIDQVEQAGARFEVVNVTVDDSLGNEYLLYVQYENPIPVHVTLRNCIFSGRGPNTSIYVHGNSTLVADHNLFHLPQNTILLTHGAREFACKNVHELGGGNLCGDPGFVRPAWGTPGDYHVRPGSPAIDAGSTVGAPSDDLEGRTRDSHPDLGAYEFAEPWRVSPQETLPPKNSILLECYPNPSHAGTTIRFSVPLPGVLRVDIFDVRGGWVSTVCQASGRDSGTVWWDGTDAIGMPVPSGVYLCRVALHDPVAGPAMRQAKLVLVR
ncbi:MAG: right-handed parallel beta-helix repeat-containing protein [candidate division KSB1 bacterium]|nr:right-handed parallel beta-helix repeat-containing protein [candidate division KSB1 bacterium]